MKVQWLGMSIIIIINLIVNALMTEFFGPGSGIVVILLTSIIYSLLTVGTKFAPWVEK